MKVYSTAEGLYLTQNNKTLKLEKVDLRIDIMKEILLADSDFKTLETHRETLKLSQAQNIRYCKNLISLVRLISYSKNQYYTLYDINGDEMIIENRDGVIFVPSCIKIDLINIKEQKDSCVNNIEVNFFHNNQTIKGFLNQNGIITQQALEACSEKEKTILISDSQTIVKKLKNKDIEIFKVDATQYQNIPMMKRVKDSINFKHDSIIFEDIDLMTKDPTFIQQEDDSTNSHVESAKESLVAKIVDYVKDIKTSWINIFHHILLYIVLLICLIVASILLIIIIKRYLKQKRRKRESPKFEVPNLEMTIFPEGHGRSIKIKEDNLNQAIAVNWDEAQELIKNAPMPTRMSNNV